MSGGGTLSVVGNNAFIGKADASATSLNVPLNLASGGALVVAGGALQLGGGGTWDSTSTATLIGSTVLRVTAGTLTEYGVLSGSGGTVDVAGGMLVLSGCPAVGTNLAFTVEGGQLQVNCPSFTPTTSISSGTLVVNQNANYSGPLVLTGSGGVSVSGGATLTLLAGGTFNSSSGVMLPSATSVILFAGGSCLLSTPTALSGVGSVVVAESATVLFLAEQISLTSSASVSVQGGTMVLSGSSPFRAPLAVTGGALIVAADTVFASGGGLSVGGAGAVNVTGAVATLSSGSSCSISGSTIFIGASSSLVLAASCVQSGGSIAGAGTLEISGAFTFAGGAWTGPGPADCLASLSISGAVSISRPVCAAFAHILIAC